MIILNFIENSNLVRAINNYLKIVLMNKYIEIWNNFDHCSLFWFGGLIDKREIKIAVILL